MSLTYSCHGPSAELGLHDGRQRNDDAGNEANRRRKGSLLASPQPDWREMPLERNAIGQGDSSEKLGTLRERIQQTVLAILRL
jgi:hypothetical protein